MVLDVQDIFCPWNTGRFHLQADGDSVSCERTSASPDIRLTSAELARPSSVEQRWPHWPPADVLQNSGPALWPTSRACFARTVRKLVSPGDARIAGR
ncbi:MAG TPA: sterol carrier protein domain-containing protein [Nonomuraea sp.]|nr:sterol carrier protein domain-containing protein [Nonomuraea sp.]